MLTIILHFISEILSWFYILFLRRSPSFEKFLMYIKPFIRKIYWLVPYPKYLSMSPCYISINFFKNLSIFKIEVIHKKNCWNYSLVTPFLIFLFILNFKLLYHLNEYHHQTCSLGSNSHFLFAKSPHEKLWDPSWDNAHFEVKGGRQTDFQIFTNNQQTN